MFLIGNTALDLPNDIGRIDFRVEE